MAINILQKLIDLEAWKTGTWQELSMLNFGYQRMLLYCIKWPSSEMDCGNSWVISRLIGVSLSIKMLLLHKGTSHSETLKLRKPLKIREASILIGTKQFFAISSTVNILIVLEAQGLLTICRLCHRWCCLSVLLKIDVSYNSTAYYCAIIL